MRRACGWAIFALVLVAVLANGAAAVTTPVDPSRSTVTATPGALIAGVLGGTPATVAVKVTLKDSGGAGVAGKSVRLFVSHPVSHVTASISPQSATTDSSGAATFTVTAQGVGSPAFSATDTTDAVALTHSAAVEFEAPTTPDPTQSSVAADPASVPADGVSPVTISVTVANIAGTVLPGQSVRLSPLVCATPSSCRQANTSSGLGIDHPATGTNSHGIATFAVTSSQAQVVHYEAYVESGAGGVYNVGVGHSAVVTFTAPQPLGPASAKDSTIAASPSTVQADGQSAVMVTVTLKDANGRREPKKLVRLTQVGAAGPINKTLATITPATAATSTTGVATFTVKDKTTGTHRFQAVDTSDSVTISQTVPVTFTAVAPTTTTAPAGPSTPAADNARSSIAASPTPLLAGTSSHKATATVTVKLRTSAGVPATGKTVSLQFPPHAGTVFATASPHTATTDASGVATFTVTASGAGSEHFQAIDQTDRLSLTHIATVTYAAANAPDLTRSTVTVSPASVAANGTAAGTITVTVLNVAGAPLHGETVHVSGVACKPSGQCTLPPHSTVTPSHATTNAQGSATFAVQDQTAEAVHYTALVQTGTNSPFRYLHAHVGVTFTSGAPATGAKPGGKGWSADAQLFRGKNGQRFSYLCPANGTRGNVWGTNTYTDDSSVCTAAVNFGLITVAEGGTVTIEIRPGQPAYAASSRNGTTSQSYGSFTGSFVFVGTPTHESKVGFGGGDWSANAVDFRGQNGASYLYSCPAKGELGDVYGTGTYTDDSSVCSAAVHAGLITVAAGGDVTVQIRPGARSYSGSIQHGVTSNDWDAFDGSFVFVTG